MLQCFENQLIAREPIFNSQKLGNHEAQSHTR